MMCLALVCRTCSKSRWGYDRIPKRNFEGVKKNKKTYRVCDDCVKDNPRLIIEKFKKLQENHVLNMYLSDGSHLSRTASIPPSEKKQEKERPPHPMKIFFYDPSKDEHRQPTWGYNPAALSGEYRYSFYAAAAQKKNMGLLRLEKGSEDGNVAASDEDGSTAMYLESKYSTKSSRRSSSSSSRSRTVKKNLNVSPCASLEISPCPQSRAGAIRYYFGRGATKKIACSSSCSSSDDLCK